MPRLREETRDARRRQFLDSAWRCAAKRAFRDVTVDDVCAEAGVTKGAFYAHFRSKETLLEALIQDDQDSLEHVMVQLESGRLTPLRRIMKVAQLFVERGEDRARRQLRADLWTLVMTRPRIRKIVNQGVQRRREMLRNWITAATEAGEIGAIPANALASVLIALDDGLLLHLSLDPSAFQWSNVRKALEALLSGIQE